MLDAPPAPEGFKHRWIRAEVRGFDDRKNISARIREGYELVRRDEYPDFEAPVIDSGKFEGVFGVGGLVLARIPLDTVKERTDYFAQRNTDQQNAVDQDMMRESYLWGSSKRLIYLWRRFKWQIKIHLLVFVQ
jgi:hypothetical protein